MRRPGLPAGHDDGRGVSRARLLFRRALPLALAVPLALATTGCATKADIRDMREDLARQDTRLEALQQQNRQLMDTLALTTERLLDVRGEMANQLNQLREQIVQVGELTGQVQIRLTQFDQQLAQAMRQMGAAGAAPGGMQEARPGAPPGGQPGADPGDAGFDMAVQFYEIGLEQIERNNAGTARRAFQTVVDSFPAHPRAPDAQRQIGETYAAERNWEEALRAFDRVVERFPDSEAAPMALYRAGVISQERGNLARARQYFERVIAGYPGSDARRLADDALARLR